MTHFGSALYGFLAVSNGGVVLGKGEVGSSILLGSTITSPDITGISDAHKRVLQTCSFVQKGWGVTPYIWVRA